MSKKMTISGRARCFVADVKACRPSQVELLCVTYSEETEQWDFLVSISGKPDFWSVSFTPENSSWSWGGKVA